MKPTENTFFFLFNRVRAEAPPPIEKVELLESLETPDPKQRGLFDLFDLFDRGVSVVGKRKRYSASTPDAGNAHPGFPVDTNQP
jgi:hypothetical protein